MTFSVLMSLNCIGHLKFIDKVRIVIYNRRFAKSHRGPIAQLVRAADS